MAPFPYLCFLLFPVLISATQRYYGSYLSYGSGDTIIATFHAHGGPHTADRKWNVECLDGEALIGFQDYTNDFEKVEVFWCRFIFAYKPPTNGLYPFYPSCHVRNYTNQFFCFDPSNVRLTVNTFVTAIWDNEFNFYLYRKGTDDLNPYKCCRTPPGYYLDYTSCYYMPTHDQFWEYYDAQLHVVTYCATGYVVTGIAKKVNPYDGDYHIDWFQCCRIGFGAGANIPVAARAIREIEEDEMPRENLMSDVGSSRNLNGFIDLQTIALQKNASVSPRNLS